MRTVLFFLFFQLCTALFGVSFVWAAEESMEEKAADYEEELLDDLDTRQMQRIMDELLEEDSFSFKEIVRELMENGQAITGEQALELVEESFWKLFGENRGVFGQVLLLAFAAALMSSFVQAFDREKMGDSCFYMIYLLVFVLLLKEFRDMSGELHGVLTGIVKFMQALAPSYYIVVSAAAGVTTASLFYQIILIAIFCVEYILVTFLFPAVHIYVLLEFINLMTKEAMLSRIGELLRGGILWVQKTLLAVIAGMQIIQSLVAPALDSLKRSVLGRTASVIPGIGGAVNAVTEIIFASAVLIRNCFGAAALIALVMMGIVPVLKLGMNALVYKLTGALIQPVCDERLVKCFLAMGEGCMLLLKLLFTTQILFMLTIVILANSL
ncbi:MAG TPA: stage III sporulation protein AE [Candidatus Ruminococcus avistercoris]|nr:stage III sporulation protein AE [Candidatus Ruminococcus avistercoris]